MPENDHKIPEEDDEIAFDFGKLFKKKKKEEKMLEPLPAKKTEEESTEEQAKDIQVKEKKPFFSRIFKKKKEHVEPLKEPEEEVSIDWKKTSRFLKKYSIVFLILIPIFLSIYFRAMPAYLPVTDDWAKDTVYNYYRNQIKAEISKQYPNLPDANKNALVESQFKQMLKEQKQLINQQIKQLSQQYKQHFKDDTGQTYLLAIDPYLWYGYARNYIRNGHFGNEIKNGKPWYSLRNGRIGQQSKFKSHPFVIVTIYRIMHFFDRNVSLMKSQFYFPVIFIGLSIIPVFFIARRISNNFGGVFAGIIVAINSALLSRTPAGFADTDAYQIFFPLIIIWLFLESFEATKRGKMIIYAILSGLFTGMYYKFWKAWYIPGFIIGSFALYFIYCVVINKRHIKKNILKFLSIKQIKDTLISGGTYLLSASFFITIFTGINNIIAIIKGPLWFIRMKEVAVTTIWPNVLTTVAEFNEVPFKQIIPQLGGKILFILALAGIIISIIKRDKYGRRDAKAAILLTLWFIGTAYSFTQGLRFAILAVPPFAIAFGVACGMCYRYLSKWLTNEIKISFTLSRAIVIILLCLLLISPLKTAAATAKHEVPSMNDAWYNSLIAIKKDSKDAIITSWWDFGHWFVAIAERRVTFDGGDQGRRIHWVGKTLLTDDENEAIDILRMLNCGQEESSHLLEKYVNDDYKAIMLLKKIIRQDKKTAEKTLLKNGLAKSQTEKILNLTHCTDLIKQYYIVSEDMVGKSGVWAHFGSWNFTKAEMYQSVKGLNYIKGIDMLQRKFNLSEEEADNIYYEIQNTDADKWVSGWPSYASGLAGCNQKEEIITCGTGLQVNLTNYNAAIITPQGKAIPHSLVYINRDNKFTEKKFNNSNIGFSAALIPTEDGKYQSILMASELAGSMFTRLFFFKGHGLKHFKPFHHERQITGGEIYIYKVDWEGEEELKVFDIEKPEEEPLETAEVESNQTEEVNESE